MFVQNFDTNGDIVDCLNSRSHDPTPKLPIHDVRKFFRVTCSASEEQSGQPSKPTKPPTPTVIQPSSPVSSPVQTSDAVSSTTTITLPSEAQEKKTTAVRVAKEIDRIPKNFKKWKNKIKREVS